MSQNKYMDYIGYRAKLCCSEDEVGRPGKQLIFVDKG